VLGGGLDSSTVQTAEVFASPVARLAAVVSLVATFEIHGRREKEKSHFESVEEQT